MANSMRCGCRKPIGCLNSIQNGWRWENYPYYNGPCPGADEPVRGGAPTEETVLRRRDYGLFTAMLPRAVAANGVIPLVGAACQGYGAGFPVNSGLITVDQPGTYLASYDVRLPEGATMNTTLSLNVNDASQTSAVTQVGGEGPAGFSAQAIIDVGDRATVTLRSSEAINLAESSVQPLVTLSLVKIE